MRFDCRGVLLDVEGTTSAVAYVYDVMFPYARRRLEAFVTEQWDEEALAPIKEQFAADAGVPAYEHASDLVAEATRLMDGDVKATGLKTLQGMIWRGGFESGELRAHVYPEVADALRRWQAADVDLRVYSSGSIEAQRLFFGHSEAGDLTPLFSGHYDTTTGPKRDAASYAAIAADWRLAPGDVLFLSDVTAELDAAREAGMATVLVRRPGSPEPPDSPTPHAEATSFDELTVRGV